MDHHRTGIKKRHIVAEDQLTSDLAYEAAKNAISDANIQSSEIDLIIVATTTRIKSFQVQLVSYKKN